MHEAIVSSDTKQPALLPSDHWVFWLITRHAYYHEHNGVAATTAKTRNKFYNKLSKAVKFKCVFCREGDRDAINGKSYCPSLSSVYTTIPHDRMQLFEAIQRQDLKKQNRKSLRSLVYVTKFTL